MNRHFAALGDVWKHLVLAEVLRLNPPLHYWETHAGSATYPLSESPARLHGALRFLALAASDPNLDQSTYSKVLRAMPGFYPGSPLLAMRVLGNGATYIFCDIDPDSARSLREASAGFDARVVETDGVSTITRASEEGRVDPGTVLVHIDPFEPHERRTPQGRTPVELAASLAKEGYRVLYWYGYDAADDRGWAHRELSRLAPGVPVWCGDILLPAPFVYPERRGAWGCGIVMANMTGEEAKKSERLGRALERITTDDQLEGNDPPRLRFAVIG